MCQIEKHQTGIENQTLIESHTRTENQTGIKMQKGKEIDKTQIKNHILEISPTKTVAVEARTEAEEKMLPL